MGKRKEKLLTKEELQALEIYQGNGLYTGQPRYCKRCLCVSNF